MKQRAQELREQGDKLFSARGSLLNLWQTTAENFYPERADFTRSRFEGEEFASYLMTGMPVMARRDLANSFASMLRPRGKIWAHPRTGDERVNKDTRAREWLDAKGEVLFRFMYEIEAQLVRATKQGDNDFATFGQTVIKLRLRSSRDGLIFRNLHLRDCAWQENENQVIDTLHVNLRQQARNLAKLFPDKVSQSVKTAAEKDPFKEIKCREIIVPASEYDLGKNANKDRFPFVSLYIDVENETILEETPQPIFNFVIPRWVTVEGSPYAHSPATVIALPDARLLQQITLTLLEAGQKAVDPPMKAIKGALQGPVNLYAGGTTFVSDEYDERTGAALEQIYKDSPALGWGVDRENRIADLINKAFYLNYIQLPTPEKDMTATEFQGRVQEYIRNALPLFEPMEVEYNGQLCDKSFEILLMNGAFGPKSEMPPILSGQEIKWHFDSPLQEATERAKTQAYIQSAQLLKIAAEIDPMAKFNFNNDKAYREAQLGTGGDADWLVPEDEAEEAKKEAGRQAAAQQMAANVSQGAQVASQTGQAVQDLQAAGLV